MPITIVATAASATANSFVTAAEADDYMALRLNSSLWTSTEPKAQAVIEATRELSALTWKGTRTTAAQALSWPRTYVDNPDAGLDATDSYLDDDTIPQVVKDATCELAFEFLRAGTTDIAGTDAGAGVIQKTVDVLTTVWQPGQRPTGLGRYPRVIRLIAPLLALASGQVRLTR